MREKFKQQLEEMYRQMVIMGSLCQQAIAVAVRTLDEEEDRAEKLEAQVFAVDGEIDDMEREIEALCTKLLLKQQPVAADLRRITAALKMVTDLERIGDQASDIAELARFIRKGGAHSHLKQMAAEVIRMVSESVDAFVRLDLDQAREVIAYDDVVDRWFDQIKKELVSQIAAHRWGGTAGCLPGGQISGADWRSCHQPGGVGGVRADRNSFQGWALGGAGRRVRTKDSLFNLDLTFLWFFFLRGADKLFITTGNVKGT